jgi:hypothetical protein
MSLAASARRLRDDAANADREARMPKARRSFGLCLASGLCFLASCADTTTDIASNPVAAVGDIRANSTDTAPRSHDELPDEVLATTIPARAPSPADWFEDITESSGIHFTYRNGLESRQYAMVEEVGGGVALFDYDNDGDLDVYVTGGGDIAAGQVARGRPGALFRNDGNFQFTDLTREVGLNESVDYSHGVTVGDYDRDGWTDLFITTYGRSRLFRNINGTNFVDQTAAAGLDIRGWHTSATFLDFDNDGWLDLYVCGYVDWQPGHVHHVGSLNSPIIDVSMPHEIDAAPDFLFRGSPSGRFTDVSEAAGIGRDGRGLGVVVADLNADGWIDLYVANDVDENHLYLGGPQLPFKESAVSAGVAGSEFGVPESSMGVDAGDYDGDGRLDLFVTNYEGQNNSLYRNEGAGQFTHRSVPAGLAGRSPTNVGFATEFVDFDMDGWLDIYIVNGHVVYRARQGPYRQPAFVNRNLSGKRFEDVSDRAAPYFSVTHVGRGAAYGDLDNDGAPDLILVHQNEPVTVLRNRRTPNHWLSLLLEGVASNREAIGAVVTSQWEGRPLTRVIRGGGSYLSCSDRRVLIPCTPEFQTVEIVWPGGRRERFSGLQPCRGHRLREGTGSLPAPDEPAN